MTRLDNSCSSRMRGWPLCSVVDFAELVLSAWHLVGFLTAEMEGEKERNVNEAAWQIYPCIVNPRYFGSATNAEGSIWNF